MIISGRAVTVYHTKIACGSRALGELEKMLASQGFSGNKTFILADSNTMEKCLPGLLAACQSLSPAVVLTVEGGEESKTLAVAERLWSELLDLHAGRKSILVCLGGGVITDLGGFLASGFQRGIRYFNVPTSLIGMADAAVGGKTGVNLNSVKNQLGSFYPPSGVYIYPPFLKTLPEDHLLSGLAEVIKSALVCDEVLWNRIKKIPVNRILNTPPGEKLWQELIEKSVTLKNRIVRQDFRENGLRKILNFGHTMGHALESFMMEPISGGTDHEPEPSGAAPDGTDKTRPLLLHGEAVAIGMIAESMLSVRLAGLHEDHAREIENYLRTGYSAGIEKLRRHSQGRDRVRQRIWELMNFDKKNVPGSVRFSLLSRPGKSKINVKAAQNDVFRILDDLLK